MCIKKGFYENQRSPTHRPLDPPTTYHLPANTLTDFHQNN